MGQDRGVWARLWGSGWRVDAYRDAAAGRVRSLVGYLGALVAMATSLTTVQTQLALAQAVRSFNTEKLWERNLPEIEIKHGEVSSPVPQPFTLERDGFVFILDTTGTTTDLDPSVRQGLLLTKTDLFLRRRRAVRETRRYALEEFPDVVLNQTTVGQMLDVIKAWAWLAVGLFVFLWLWVAKLFQVLCWSLLGLLVNAASGRSLRYGALFNIGVLALTVPWAFDLLKDALHWTHWVLPWLSMGMYVGYLIWGIAVQPHPERVVSPA